MDRRRLAFMVLSVAQPQLEALLWRLSTWLRLVSARSWRWPRRLQRL